MGDQGIGGRMGSEWIKEIGWRGVKWIELVQNRDPWRALVNSEMYLWVLVLQSQLVKSLYGISECSVLILFLCGSMKLALLPAQLHRVV
jgi:hypothetical protein